jgi:hypothetical protein
LSRYGFKLLRVQLFEGRGHTPQEFHPDGQPSYIDRVESDVRAQLVEPDETTETVETHTIDVDSGEHVKITTSDVVDEPAEEPLPEGVTRKPASVIKFQSLRRLNSALMLKVQYGIVGDHQWALDPEGRRADADLRGLAATRAYRALLIVPTAGKVAMLAVEVISRSHPSADLPRRLANAAVGHNLRIRSKGPIADERAVQALMRDGRVTGVELRKSFVTSDQGSNKVRSVKLQFPITVGASEGPRIISHVRNWVSPPKAGDDAKPVNPATEATALASILWSELADLKFDDARVEIKSDVTNRRLKPLDRSEGFVYELGDDQPDDDEFIHRVSSIAQSLFDAQEMSMENDWAIDKN